MKTIATIFLFLQFFHTVSTFFDIDELKSINYGIDIRNEPIVMKSEVSYFLKTGMSLQSA